VTGEVRAIDQPATVAVLTRANLGDWVRAGWEAPRAGRLGPYGFDHLAALGWRVNWSDGGDRGPWTAPGVRRLRARLDRGPWAGQVKALTSRRAVASADVVLSLFEDQGLAALTAKRFGLGPYAGRPHVLVSCWLAERLPTMDPARRDRVVASARAAERIVVFSRNQVERLRDLLDVPEGRVVAVEFGIDDAFFPAGPDRAQRSGHAGGRTGPVTTIGRDSARDLATFAAAVAPLEHDALVVRHRDGTDLDLPANCAVRYDISHDEYRAVLAEAPVVVLPTTAPAYPAASTVLVEALASGCPTVVTDSPAIRDYVRPGVDGLVVPRGDAPALRAAVAGLLADPAGAARMGEEGRRRVRARFTHARMWDALSAVLHDAVAARG
jgi:glycosyltransferase involved in cell wall biosynthesis